MAYVLSENFYGFVYRQHTVLSGPSYSHLLAKTLKVSPFQEDLSVFLSIMW